MSVTSGVVTHAARPASGGRWAGVVALVLAFGLPAMAVARLSPRTMWVLLGLIVTCAQVVVLRTCTGERLPLAAVLLVPLNVVGIVGCAYYDDVAAQAIVSFRLPQTDEVNSAAHSVFILASIAVFGGGLLGAIGSRQEASKPTYLYRSAFGRISPLALLFSSAVPIAFTIVGFTPGALWDRAHYLDYAGPQAAVSAGSLLTPPAVALLSVILFDQRSHRLRPLATLLLVAYGTLLFAVGTRQLAMLPALVLVGRLVAVGNTRQSRLGVGTLLITALLTMIAFEIPLSVRAETARAGLQPFGQQLIAHPASVIRLTPAELAGNVLFAAPLTGTVASAVPELPDGVLTASLDPRPGAFSNWEGFHRSLQLNRVTPFSGLGELANIGASALIGVVAAFAFLVTSLQRWNRRLPRGRRAAVELAGIGMTALLALDLLQYNLRTGTRLVWYFLALSIALHLRPRKRSTSRPA